MTGIDISHHQGLIDWKKVALDPAVQFAFLKATEGTTYTDPKLTYNATEADKAGVHISYYHFAGLKDPTLEAAHFISAIAPLPIATLPIVLDIEENKAQLTNGQMLDWINAFFAHLISSGYHDYALYSYTPFLNSNLPSNHNLGGVMLWIAAYTKVLKLPHGWAKEWIWQYSAKGNVKGINGNVDINKSPQPLY